MVTNGEEIVTAGAVEARHRPEPVETVSPLGAGDAFMGGLAAGLARPRLGPFPRRRGAPRAALAGGRGLRTPGEPSNRWLPGGRKSRRRNGNGPPGPGAAIRDRLREMCGRPVNLPHRQPIDEAGPDHPLPGDQ